MNINKNDVRYKKTHKLIIEAFKQLASEMPYDKITVSELTEKTGIHRKTFYLHFDSMPVLAEYLENKIVEEYHAFQKKYIDNNDIPGIIREVYRYFYSQPYSFQAFICSQPFIFNRTSVNDGASNIPDPSIANRISNKLVDRYVDDSMSFKESLVIPYMFSAIYLYRYWHTNGRPISLEELTEYSIKAICFGLSGISELMKNDTP